MDVVGKPNLSSANIRNVIVGVAGQFRMDISRRPTRRGKFCVAWLTHEVQGQGQCRRMREKQESDALVSES